MQETNDKRVNPRRDTDRAKITITEEAEENWRSDTILSQSTVISMLIGKDKLGGRTSNAH